MPPGRPRIHPKPAPRPPRPTPEERFIAKVRRDRDGHWRWQGTKDMGGYGKFFLNGTMTTAHRAAWLLYRGPIPDGAELHHICRVRDCVRPDHLDIAMTVKEHRVKEGRKAVCKHGHPMEGDNVGWTTRACGRTDRYCRACQYASNRRSYAAHIEERRAYAREYAAQHVRMSVSTDSE